MDNPKVHIFVLTIVAATVFFAGLGSARLWDRDEPRNAGCAREMMARGDWVTPIFNDELRGHKPVLLYWLMMSAYSVFGDSEFAARFWSAALAVGTVLMTYLVGCRLFSIRQAFWSALILSTSLMFVVAARAATPDSVLIFCSTAVITIYVLGTFPKDDSNFSQDSREFLFPKHWAAILGMWAMAGLGVLAKGPVGVVLPMAVIGLFMMISAKRNPHPASASPSWQVRLRRFFSIANPWHFLRTLFAMKPVIGALVVLAVAAPWYVWVGLRTEGDFLSVFFLREHFGRATTSFENHSGSIFYYPLAIMIGFFPWSILTVPVICDLFRKNRSSSDTLRTTLPLCWIAVYVGVFTIAQTKLPSYVSPCYPGLALLAGGGMVRLNEIGSRVRWGWYAAAAVMAIVGAGILIGVPLAVPTYLEGMSWLALFGLPLLLGGVAAAVWLRKSQWSHARWTLAAASIAFVICLFGVGTWQVDRKQQSDRLFTAITENQTSEEPLLASYGVLESSWVYYTRRPIYEIHLPGTPADPYATKTDGNGLAREKNWKPKPRPELNEFLSEENEKFLITTRAHLPSLLESLPSEFEVLAEAQYFLKDESLVLIGIPRQSPERIAEAADSSSATR